MREHRRRGYIPDSEDVRHVGTHVPIDRYVATIGYIDARIIGANGLAVGDATYRHQYPVVHLGLGGFFALEPHAQAFGERLHASHLGAREDLLITAFDPL